MSKPTHYPLTTDEFLKLNAELTDAELRVYLYLMTLNPFHDSIIEIDTAKISEQLGLTEEAGGLFLAEVWRNYNTPLHMVS